MSDSIFNDLLSVIPGQVQARLVREFLSFVEEYTAGRAPLNPRLEKAREMANFRRYADALEMAAWAAAEAWARDYDDAEDPPYEGYELAVDEFRRLARNQ
jgi:hypothetical protein